MDIIVVSLIWLVLLLAHKHYKDSIINRQQRKIRFLEAGGKIVVLESTHKE